jgi:hypothetical protein
MATTIESETTPVRNQPGSTDQGVADAFVIFGITGDLAKVMTWIEAAGRIILTDVLRRYPDRPVAGMSQRFHVEERPRIQEL